jgi:hypothetical protein
MAEASIQRVRRRGITVLGLLLVIIALMVAGFFLVRYLRTRQAAPDSPPLVRPEPEQRGSLRLHQPLDELDLPGVIQVVRRDAVDLLPIGPHPARGAAG